MNRIGSPAMLLSEVNDALRQQTLWQRRFLWIVFIGLGLLVVFSAVQSPSAQTWLLVLEDQNSTLLRDAEMDIAEDKNSTLLRDAESGPERNWNTWTTRAAGWEIRRADQDEEDQEIWAGRQMMRRQRADDSLWWDERAEQYFISKLEKSQFPANCSQAHWIAHYDFVAGLFSSVHQFLLPLFFAMVRGHPLVPISEVKRHPAFYGCGPNIGDRNMQCFFNVTNCDPGEDPSRLSKILTMPHDRLRTSWEEVLMEDDDFFTQGGVTVTTTFKQHVWATNVCVGSSTFSSFREAYTYHKFSLFEAMGRHGKVGVVTDVRTNAAKTCSGNQEEDSRLRRVDMVMTSLMSSWMLNQMQSNVKLVADEIMSRYVDSSGQPLWKPPVLAIHIRQTDKKAEDPYFTEHGVYRPVEDYALHMKQMEEEYRFQWPSIFIISDSGTARESLVAILNGNVSAAPGNSTSIPQDKKRFIMYDWIEDDHLQDKFHDHSKVPKYLKHDMQVHFLATLYILQKIADHAIVTYSSNVGRFIGEIMAAKHRLAFVDRRGPLVTSLDYPWFWA